MCIVLKGHDPIFIWIIAQSTPEEKLAPRLVQDSLTNIALWDTPAIRSDHCHIGNDGGFLWGFRQSLGVRMYTLAASGVWAAHFR